MRVKSAVPRRRNIVQDGAQPLCEGRAFPAHMRKDGHDSDDHPCHTGMQLRPRFCCASSPGYRVVNAEFLITSFLIVASPGTGVLYTVSTGLSRGVRASLAAAVGCTLGTVPHMALAVLGLAAVFRASTVAFELLTYLGSAYLLYMAWNLLRDRSALGLHQEIAMRSPWRIAVSAVLLNLLNPKLPIFFLAFLPQFLARNDPSPVTHLLALSAVFMLMTLAVFACYGVFASFMRVHVLARPKVTLWLRRAFAAAFVALGLKLMLLAGRT